PRSIERERVFGRGVALRAEGAADIAADDAKAVLRNFENVLGEGPANAMDRADAAIEREFAVARIIVADAAARLDRVVHDPADDEALARDVMRRGESRLDGRFVAELEDIRDIVRTFGPDCGSARRDRIDRARDRSQRLIDDLDPLGGVLRLGKRLGDDIGDLVADEMRRAAGKAGMRALMERRAVGALARHADFERADAVGFQILAREDTENARHPRRGARID